MEDDGKEVARSEAAGGVYVHLPFCPYICPYCDFAKWRYGAEPARRYLRALDGEIAAAPHFRATTAFFGGGTPNRYPAETIADIVARLTELFALPRSAETTIEVNPDLALCRDFGAYRAAGISRLSIGAQSFDPRELRVLGRGHGPDDVREAARRARVAGFDNVSIDLIFGIPRQTPRSWRATLEAALGLEVGHISTYGLTIEDGTPYARWFAREPQAFAGQDLEAELYGIAIDALAAAGYEHYEISNFARPGFRSAHNANYWANGEYLGFGVGAASYLGGVRRTNTRNLEAYVAAALAGEPVPGESELLHGASRVGEAAMLALRTAQGVDVRVFAERYAVDFLEIYRPVLDEMSSAGLLLVTPTRVALTRRGRFVANDVCAAFVVPA
jgi:oxygen-independent coproporphyrinogen-3 oxidase